MYVQVLRDLALIICGVPICHFSPLPQPKQLVVQVSFPLPLSQQTVFRTSSCPPQPLAVAVALLHSSLLQVCREYQRGACKRAESECRFAHPPDTVTANEDGTVTVCMDAVKGRCNRDPCRYFHPPLHLQAHIKAAQSRASPVGISRSPRALLLSASCHMCFLVPYQFHFFKQNAVFVLDFVLFTLFIYSSSRKSLWFSSSVSISFSLFPADNWVYFYMVPSCVP